MKTPLFKCLLNTQTRRQHLVVDSHALRGALRQLFAVSQHPGHGLTVIVDEMHRKQRLVMQDRTGVVLTRNIFGGQHAPDPRHVLGIRAIHRQNARMRVRRLHGIQTQGALRHRQFIGVRSTTGDMRPRAFVFQVAHAETSIPRRSST